ncbi:MAG: hypothetical protein HYR88_14635 [Verrucomicrobia bacterium]|nr:hypothetical protein [Verrucomicrobiota bacterium]MBI3867920.1 hypothetical protein [Verrucomicrobiota bacterium]
MNAIELPYLKDVFDRLKRGSHLSPEDEPLFSALASRAQDYADYFAPLGLRLVRHDREFFYFEPDYADKVPDTLPKIAVFSYILVDHAANQGRPVEEFVMGQNFLLSRLPHFALDRYVALLRQVDVEDLGDVKLLLGHMERIGWIRWEGEEEFRFLRPFHRVFSKCLELAQRAPVAPIAPAVESSPSA